MGSRVQHWWGGDNCWFSGRIIRYNAGIGEHLVKYDLDEEEIWVKIDSSEEAIMTSSRVVWAQAKGHALWPGIEWSWSSATIGVGGFNVPTSVAAARSRLKASPTPTPPSQDFESQDETGLDAENGTASKGRKRKTSRSRNKHLKRAADKDTNAPTQYITFFGDESTAWCSLSGTRTFSGPGTNFAVTTAEDSVRPGMKNDKEREGEVGAKGGGDNEDDSSATIAKRLKAALKMPKLARAIEIATAEVSAYSEVRAMARAREQRALEIAGRSGQDWVGTSLRHFREDVNYPQGTWCRAVVVKYSGRYRKVGGSLHASHVTSWLIF